MNEHSGLHQDKWQISNRGVGYYPWQKDQLIDAIFPDILDKICECYPDQLAFCYTELNYTRTYQQFREDVDIFARALIAMGVGFQDKVAIWATNVPEWFITFWAVAKIGAILVNVNTGNKIHEMGYLLKHSDTHTLIMIDSYKSTDYNEIIKKLIPELASNEPGNLKSVNFPFLKNIINISSKLPGCYTWDEAVAKHRNVPLYEVERRRRNICKDDVMSILYTSGTSGLQKGVMLTHYSMINNGKAIGDCMDLSTADRMMVQTPMFHCSGSVLAMTAAVTHGVAMFPIITFSPRKGLKCIDQKKITCFHGVPTMYVAMLSHEDLARTDFSYVRTGAVVGSPCPIKTIRDIIEKMNMSEICIGYGQTEASPAITMSKTTDPIETRVNTVGSPIFGVECKIVDIRTGQEVPDGMVGEICTRGYNVMKGYYKMPKATTEVVDEEGWLHTGDTARRLPGKGYFQITGRIKDMIIRGGENLYPKEIEDFISTHPDVLDVRVIGVPDRQYGEEAMAYIILKAGAVIKEDDIKEFVRSHMDKVKVPRYVRFVESFPMNAAGKVLKNKLREEAVEYLNLHDNHFFTE